MAKTTAVLVVIYLVVVEAHSLNNTKVFKFNGLIKPQRKIPPNLSHRPHIQTGIEINLTTTASKPSVNLTKLSEIKVSPYGKFRKRYPVIKKKRHVDQQSRLDREKDDLIAGNNSNHSSHHSTTTSITSRSSPGRTITSTSPLLERVGNENDGVSTFSDSNEGTHSTPTAYPSHKRNITIGFLPAINAAQRRFSDTSKNFLGAFKIALRDMNEKVLKDSPYYLDYIMHDNRANTEESLRGMTELYNKGCLAFLGPEGLCAVEARLAGAWNIPMFSFRCRESTVSNKDGLYPTFVRTIPSTSKVSKSLISIMQHFKWTIFQAIVEDNPIWIEAALTLRQLSETYDIKMNPDATIRPSANFPIHELSNILEQTYEKTRIYVVLGDYDIVIHFVSEIHRKRLDTGKYVVIAVIEEPYDPEQPTKYFRTSLYDKGEGHMSIVKFLLLLLPSTPSNPLYKNFLDDSRFNSYQAPFNFPTPLYPHLQIKVPIFAAYLYDAVSLYARAVKEAGEEGLDLRNGTLIITKIARRTYESIQGNTMFIDAHGNAEANYTLLALLPDEPEGDDEPSYKVQIVGHFLTHEYMIPFFTPVADIPWIGGKVPLSEPECGFDGTRCQIQSYWFVAILCTVAAFVITIAVIFVCRHYIYEQKLASLMWKIDYRDLVVVDRESDTFTEKVVRLPFGFLTTQLSDTIETDLHPKFKIVQYKKQTVAVKIYPRKHIEINREVKEELYQMREMLHDNINRFIGACVEPTFIVIIMHYCPRGSLRDILENEAIHLDDMLISSLVFDLIKGMIYLHDSSLICHGRLRPSNCLVDSRWVLQVSDFGLNALRDESISTRDLDDRTVSKLLWQAPEVLRSDKIFRGTQKGDVYSFGLILYEIFTRNKPWSHVGGSDSDILDTIMNPNQGVYLRPNTSILTYPDFVIKCMNDCWHEDENLRPDFKNIRNRLKPMLTGLSANIFDNMLAIMEKYANRLEFLVEERTTQLAEEKRKLAEEKKKTETLLLSMLPVSVAEQLIKGSEVVPEQYECVTIYFSDIVSFTTLSAESTPMQMVDMLNDLYTLFDSIIGNYDVYKVETIGDAYMVVSGLPIRNADRHAGEIASMSLCLLSAIETFQIRHKPDQSLKLRIGIHSGPVVAGVVGRKMPRYCLFGDTVNTASRLETTGEEMKIHCSSDCKAILDKLGGYQLELRGLTSLKGRGEMVTYFVAGEDPYYKIRRTASHKNNMSTSALGMNFKFSTNKERNDSYTSSLDVQSSQPTPNSFRKRPSFQITKSSTPRSFAKRKYIGLQNPVSYPDNFDPFKRRCSVKETERKPKINFFNKLETHMSAGSLDIVSNNSSSRLLGDAGIYQLSHASQRSGQFDDNDVNRTSKDDISKSQNLLGESLGHLAFKETQLSSNIPRQMINPPDSAHTEISPTRSNPLSGFFGSIYSFMKGYKSQNMEDEKKRRFTSKTCIAERAQAQADRDKENGGRLMPMKRRTSKSCDPLLGSICFENQENADRSSVYFSHNQRSNSFGGRNSGDVFYVFNFNANPFGNRSSPYSFNKPSITTIPDADEGSKQSDDCKQEDDCEGETLLSEKIKESSLTESAMFDISSDESSNDEASITKRDFKCQKSIPADINSIETEIPNIDQISPENSSQSQFSDIRQSRDTSSTAVGRTRRMNNAINNVDTNGFSSSRNTSMNSQNDANDLVEKKNWRLTENKGLCDENGNSELAFFSPGHIAAISVSQS